MSEAIYGRNICDTVTLIIMGVSGCGKTTIATLLSGALVWKYQEGDHLHPAVNVEKMRGGTPLTDEDRLPWLAKIAEVIDCWRAGHESGVVTCSALKRSYRKIIVGSRPEVQLVYLKGEYGLIRPRLAARHEHYMPAALLKSQFATLEEPAVGEHPIVIEVKGSPTDIATEIIRQLGEREVIEDGLMRRAAEWLLGGTPAKDSAAVPLSRIST